LQIFLGELNKGINTNVSLSIAKVDTKVGNLGAKISGFDLFGKYQKHWQPWATE